MADDQTTETVTVDAPIKSTLDLELERLNARLDALESENRELRSANQGLWAQLHPVQEQPTITEPSVELSETDLSYDAFKNAIGLKEE